MSSEINDLRVLSSAIFYAYGRLLWLGLYIRPFQNCLPRALTCQMLSLSAALGPDATGSRAAQVERRNDAPPVRRIPRDRSEPSFAVLQQRAVDLVLVIHLPLRPPVAAFCVRLDAYWGSVGIAGNSFCNWCRPLEHVLGLQPARSTKEPQQPQAARVSRSGLVSKSADIRQWLIGPERSAR